MERELSLSEEENPKVENPASWTKYAPSTLAREFEIMDDMSKI
jgi:hypothetical protein